MKIQNNTTKTATTIVMTSAIVLAILSPSTILPTINAIQAGTSAFEKLNLKEIPPAQTTQCTDILTHKTQERGMSIDNIKAKSLASSNSDFVKRIQGYTPQFNSINIIGSYDPTTCAATWNQVNVVYALHNSKGYVKSIYVEEDPSLTKVTGFVERVDKQIKYGNIQSQNWSGYEFYHTTTNGATQIYESKATWDIPTITNPNYPSPGDCSNECDNICMART
ncbi:MAG: hypothetical protein KGL95_14335 [Patescibacteria group bacterium]|nr:hypothetical protein [Patescibacteria group bacterium]